VLPKPGPTNPQLTNQLTFPAFFAVDQGLRALVLPVRAEQGMGPVPQHQEHDPQAVRRPLPRHFRRHLRKVWGMLAPFLGAWQFAIFNIAEIGRNSDVCSGELYELLLSRADTQITCESLVRFDGRFDPFSFIM
jgi:hypothetical protein